MNQLNKNRTFLITFMITAVAAVVIIRFVQFATDVIDFNTGFFYHYAGPLKYLHYITLGVVFVGLIILVITEKKRKTRFFNKRLSHFDDSDTAICGIMLLLAAFAVVYTAINTGFANQSTAEILTAFLGTVAYSFSGGVLLFKKRAFPSIGIAFLALSGYYVARLIALFLSNHIIFSMSEHLTVLIFTIMAALFYLTAGRIFMRVESKSTRFKTCVFGFSAVIIAASEIIAKVVFMLGSPSVTRYNLVGSASTQFIAPDMLFAAETIAILVFLLSMARVKHEKGERKRRWASRK
ncbi:MAG: hypothetical protein LBC86_08840 [Oscillospiraceae bacterium]|nr:hypothetical protein [Oscillospiraceae bacterium]